MKVNDKIIQRSIAKSIVYDTNDLVKLLRSYTTVDDNISSLDLLLKVQKLLAENEEFADKYTRFLLKKKRLLNYNSAIGILSGITSLVGSIVDAGAEKKQQQLAYQQLYSQNTQQLMNMMMMEEQSKLAKEQQKSNLVYIVIGGVVLLTSLMIFLKK